MTITLAALHIYPVKSLGGVALESAQVTVRGLEFDRRWMIVDPDDEFVTQREHPRLATIWVDVDAERLSFSAPDMDSLDVPHGEVSGPRRKVRVWSSVVEADPVSSAADAWLSEYLGMTVRLVHLPDDVRRDCNPKYARPGEQVGFADGYPLLVCNQGSLDDLNARMARSGASPALPMSRFRPNIVLAGAAPWAEDHWDTLAIGAVELRVAKPCGRCQVTTTDQATGEVRGPEPLATLASFRESAEFGIVFGQNCTPLQLGRLEIGTAATVMTR